MSVIVITGASSGIGQALAEHYAAPGVTLGLLGRNAERLERVAATCKAKGANVAKEIIDVSDRATMAAWLSAFDDAYPIDLLIANAGVGGGFKNAADPASYEDAREMFTINIDGVLNTIDPIVPRMCARERGQVAMMASLAGFRGLAGAPGYAASKGFVKLYGEGLRGALEPYGVAVNVICPGFVDSRLTILNDFPMPFFMQAPKAAAIIARGLKKNRARIAFPGPMVFGAWFLSVLPAALGDFIARRLPKKN